MGVGGMKYRAYSQKEWDICFNTHEFHEPRITLLMRHASGQLKGEGG